MLAKNSRLSLVRCLLVSLAVSVFLSSGVSFSALDKTSPTAPSNLTATAVPQMKVVLSWKPSTDDIGVAGYNVYKRLASGGSFSKVNATLIKGLSFEDKKASAGKNYEYAVRAADAAGNLSELSNLASAPSVVMSEKAIISHMGKVAASARPGDSIEYLIDYTNKGYGFAKNVAILHSVPKGTTLLERSVVVKKGSPATILYLSKKTGEWSDKYSGVGDVAKVKFVLKDSVPAIGKGANGTLSLKVIVEE